jgi:tetratricopeptide (TPR) repeat protein
VYKNYQTQNPEAAEIFNQLGLCKIKSGAYEEALSAFKSAANVENNGMERTLELNQIIAYEYTGNFKQATVLMEAYLKKYPDDETALREYEFLKTR